MLIHLYLSSDCPWGDAQSWCADFLQKNGYSICANEPYRQLCCKSCHDVRDLKGHTESKYILHLVVLQGPYA